MDVTVYDITRKAIGIMENPISIVWAERFQEYGDFELTASVTDKALSLLAVDNFLSIPHSERWMIVERLTIVTDKEDGNKIRASGRSLESILTRRRCVARNGGATQFTPPTWNVYSAIRGMLYNTIREDGYPGVTETGTEYPGFYHPSQASDTELNAVLLEEGFTFYADLSLYDAIRKLCLQYDLGFKTVVDTIDNHVNFSVLLGKDRSKSQTTNPHVVFSSDYDNLIYAEFVHDTTRLKNHAACPWKNYNDPYDPDWWQWEIPNNFDRTNETVPPIYGAIGTESYKYGLRETYLDYTQIPRDEAEGGELTVSEYNDLLYQEALRQMREPEESTFYQISGKADTTSTFKYGEDFFLGDTVQIEDDFGHSGPSKVVEVIISEELDEFGIYPSFEPIE